MNRLEHLLFIVAEECAEVTQCASKCARFGVDGWELGQPTNQQRLWKELNDLFAVVDMLGTECGVGGFDVAAMQAKKEKVEKFLLYSAEIGTLEVD